MYMNGVGVAVLVNASHRASLHEDRRCCCDCLVSLGPVGRCPEDGVSPTREAEPTPGGDDCTENACGLNPSPVLSIAPLSKVQTAAQSYG